MESLTNIVLVEEGGGVAREIRGESDQYGAGGGGRGSAGNSWRFRPIWCW